MLRLALFITICLVHSDAYTQQNAADYCVHESMEPDGMQVTINCAPKEERNWFKTLTNVKYIWSKGRTYWPGESTRQIMATHGSAGGYRCRAAGLNQKGKQEATEYFQYIMPQKFPLFIMAYQVRFFTKRFDIANTAIARKAFASLATPEKDCKMEPICIIKPAFHCWGRWSVVQIIVAHRENNLESYKANGERPAMLDAQLANKLLQRIKKVMTKLPEETRNWLGKLSNLEYGYGFGCPAGWYSKMPFVKFNEALKRGMNRLPYNDIACYPCPQGYSSNRLENKCVPCKPKQYNDKLGQIGCTPCPHTKMTRLSYSGAVDERECFSTATERPLPRYPMSCKHVSDGYH